MTANEMTTADRLNDLALNLRWDWNPPVRSLFRSLDPDLWELVEHNPVALLRRIDPDRFQGDPELDRRTETMWRELRDYLEGAESPVARDHAPADRPLTAYFSAEYGLTESLRIYSGGLGILAGDHLKSASDLGVSMVAVGLLYREGYFRQEITGRGRQRESFPPADFDDLPLRPVKTEQGELMAISVPFPGRRVFARLWRADVGRVPLYLLDTDVPENRPRDRRITGRLYGGNNETRITQEVILGMGGYRALREMGIRPRSFHMNEGHSAFLGLDLVRDLIETEGLSLEEAIEAARERGVFTTHTPVPAGHDRFSRELMERYFTQQAHGLGLDLDGLMALGQEDPEVETEPFTMTVLALRLAAQINGVSRLHGRVSREMWNTLWPEREVEEVPIGHITNGVHLPSWVAEEVSEQWTTAPAVLGSEQEQPAPDPDPQILWQVRNRLRRRLVDWVRERGLARMDPDALTLSFARRFATYKRATLLLSDPDRLSALLDRADRPVQILFAGKAHPKDEGGKALIQRLGELARKGPLRDRVVFVPDYDMDVARQLVQGADVWLNNPRRPMEASGTSGMKAAANGVLNVSILDGWWDEAYRAAEEKGVRIGWAVGRGTEAEDPATADQQDMESLFSVLEEEVVPAFYDRDAAGYPARWAELMAASIREVAPVFNTHRMVREYAERYRRAAESDALEIGR